MQAGAPGVGRRSAPSSRAAGARVSRPLEGAARRACPSLRVLLSEGHALLEEDQGHVATQ